MSVCVCIGQEGRESREFIPSCGEFALGSAHSSTEFTLLGDLLEAPPLLKSATQVLHFISASLSRSKVTFIRAGALVPI